MFGRAIQGDVDALDTGVDGGFAQEIDKVLESVVGIIQEYIAPGNDVEDTRKEGNP